MRALYPVIVLILSTSLACAEPTFFTDPSPTPDKIAGCAWKVNTKKFDLPATPEGVCKMDAGTLTSGTKEVSVRYYYFENEVRKETGPSNTVGITRTDYVAGPRFISGQIIDCKPTCTKRY